MMPFSTHLLSTTRNHRNSGSNNITSSSRLVQHLLLGSCLLLLISGSSSQARLLNRRDLPLSMDKEMFPAQDFDEEAPICMAEREPCGFYSFSLDGKAPLKWIKSWCRCTAKQECVYERTDMRMRVYRQTCVPKEVDEVEEEAISEEQQQQQQHERSLTSSASQPVEFQQQPTAAEEDQQQLRDLDSSSLAAPVSSRHHHHHHHHHHNRHIRKANRRIIRRLRAILVD